MCVPISLCVPVCVRVCVGVIILTHCQAQAHAPRGCHQASLVTVAIAIASAWWKCCCQLVTNVFVAQRNR